MIQYYYPKTFKGVTVALLDMFNQMVVHRTTSGGLDSGDLVKEVEVPLMYGHIEKEHRDRLENHYYDNSDVEHGNRFYLQVPRMSLLMDGISYNPNRAFGVNEWRYWFAETVGLSGNEIESVLADYQPTPWDISYTLYIRTDSMDDFAQIMENILPYFNPKLFLRVKEFSFLNIERDLPVSIGGVSPEFIDEMNENETRQINAAISLTVEAFQYRPFTYSKIIKLINSRYWIGESDGYDISGVPLSAAGTYQVMDYSTSGVHEVSAAPDPSTYDFSGYNADNEAYWYTSATSIDDT